MNMHTRRSTLVFGPATLLAAALCLAVGCGGDDLGGTDVGDQDVAEQDAAEDTQAVDTAPDIVEDTAVDTAPDVVEDATVDAVEDTVADAETDAETDAEADTADVMDEPDVPADAGTDCEGRPDLCADPYICINRVCRLPAGDRVLAENGFSIEEPEELTQIFEILKAIAADMSYMLIVIEDSADRTQLPLTYGAADRMTSDEGVFTYSWQYPEVLQTINMTPMDNPDDPLNGDIWISEEFEYVLEARIIFEAIMANVGMTAENASLQLTFDAETDEVLGDMDGLITREQAEGRFMQSAESFATFIALACTNRDHEPADPDVGWYLSDVLDCNDAPLDADIDGDGVMDSYYTRVEARFLDAVLVDAMP